MFVVTSLGIFFFLMVNNRRYIKVSIWLCLILIQLVFVGSRGEPGDRSCLGRSNHTSERDIILLPKTLRQWVLSLIKCSTSTFLSDMEHITHTCTQQSPPQHTLMLLPPLSPHTTESAAWTPFVRRTFDTRSRSNSSSNHGSDTTVGSWGEPGDRPHLGQSNRTSVRDAKLLPKTLRQWVYGSSHL